MNSLLKSGLEKATNVVSDVKDTAKDKARALSEDAKDKANVVKNVAVDKANVVKNAAVDQAMNVKNKVKDLTLNVAQSIVDKALTKLADKVVDVAVRDPDMPYIVKQGINSIVQDVVKEVKVEVEQKLEGTWAGNDKQVAADILAPRNPFCCPNPLSYLRAWVLHTLYPHDKSLWAKMKQVSWWFIMIISHLPFWGLSQLWWFIVFLLHDKYDTYQVVKFILQVKTSAVIAVGLIPSWLGILAYIQCVDPNDGKSTCIKNGPGSGMLDGPGMLQTLFFILQILLSWFAVLCLPCTKAKGVRKIIAGENKVNSRGIHKLVYWIVYDLIVCILIAVLIVMPGPDGNNALNAPNDDTRFYWIKVLYGWLCLPWFILKMPFMNLLILHTRPTAYNAQGKTVPFANSKERKFLRDRRRNIRSVLPA